MPGAPSSPGGAAGPGHGTPYTGEGKAAPYGHSGIAYGITAAARPGPGTGPGPGRDGAAPGADPAGTGHLLPGPVLTEFTYEKRNTTSVATGHCSPRASSIPAQRRAPGSCGHGAATVSFVGLSLGIIYFFLFMLLLGFFGYFLYF